MKIYTRTGDRGTTALLGKRRVPKDAPRVAAFGALDETNAAIGVAAAFLSSDRALRGELVGELLEIQEDLFQLGAYIATPVSNVRGKLAPPTPDRTLSLERAIDRMETGLPPLRNFILPGGVASGALLHLARTIARRAERAIVSLSRKEKVAADALTYLNRLSDYLFVAARFANRTAGIEELPWRSAGERTAGKGTSEGAGSRSTRRRRTGGAVRSTRSRSRS